MSTSSSISHFSQFSLQDALLKALEDVGYEAPSPVQAQTIPMLLEGRDLVGQAQTGTGKTAAFALPLLSRLSLQDCQVQVLVLTPTRELAIQVAEAMQKYAKYLQGFHILPIYGGQEFTSQLRALKRGVHVVVGTPGRVMDHMRRGTLKLTNMRSLVLDEADEMLRMGFIDDVTWILEQAPATRQIALFSATMPAQIRKIATQYLNNPAQVTIDVKTATADTIRQRYWLVSGVHKLDALTRILEVEPFDAMIVFVRTKSATSELAEKLEARGFASAALNGDMAQQQREKTVESLKNGKLDILVATDVAARGLDVQRISHVVNYDIPYDTEAYIHRIGRTGRAGREGDAILFVAPREKRMLGIIEKATRQKIEYMDLPSMDLVNDRRESRLKQRISEILASKDLELYQRLVERYQREHDVSTRDIAAALAYLSQSDAPLINSEEVKSGARGKKEQGTKEPRIKERSSKNSDRKPSNKHVPEQGMERFRIEVGRTHGVKPENIVGAIANEAGIDAQYIGRIDILDNYSIVDLPEGMPREIFHALKRVWVSGTQLQISRVQKKAIQSDKSSKKRNNGKRQKSPEQSSKQRRKAKPAKAKRKKAK